MSGNKDPKGYNGLQVPVPDKKAEIHKVEELLKPILEDGSGLVCGRDFYLGFSPERVDPGNLIYKTKNTPKVVGAISHQFF